MRIMIDTNILLSALVFRSTKMAGIIDYIAESSLNQDLSSKEQKTDCAIKIN